MKKMKIWKRERKKLMVSGILSIVIAYIFYNSIIGLIIFPFLYFCIRKVMIEEEKQKAEQKLKGMFRDMILSMAAALEAGYSVEKAMKPVKEEMSMLYGDESIIVEEVERIIQKIEANHPVEKAFEESAKHMKIEESKDFAETFKIGKRIGGDMNCIIMDTVTIISEKIETDKEIESNLAAKRFEFRVMCIMPFAIISYVRFSSPGYFNALYHNLFGVLVMTFVIIMIGCSYLIAKKMINIRV